MHIVLFDRSDRLGSNIGNYIAQWAIKCYSDLSPWATMCVNTVLLILWLKTTSRPTDLFFIVSKIKN